MRTRIIFDKHPKDTNHFKINVFITSLRILNVKRVYCNATMSIVNNHYVYVLDFERIDEYNDFTSYHTAN